MTTTITFNLSPGRSISLTLEEAHRVHDELCQLFGRDAAGAGLPSYPQVPVVPPLAPDPLAGYIWSLSTGCGLFDGRRVED